MDFPTISQYMLLLSRFPNAQFVFTESDYDLIIVRLYCDDLANKLMQAKSVEETQNYG